MTKLWNAGALALTLATVASGVVMGSASCADSIDIGEQETDAAVVIEAGPSFVPPVADGGDAGDAQVDAPLLLCAATSCAYPWESCIGSDGTLPAYACSTNVSSDVYNCGGCNVECPHGNPSFSLTPTCVDGACQYACSPGSYDCNGIIDDGCEVFPNSDPNNCGACGNKCADGVTCINGTCGCPPGQTLCGDSCVDLQSDDGSCGQCGYDCRSHPPVDGGDVPPNMIYGCKAGKCEDLHCYQDVGQNWKDCNGSIHPDGCEVNIANSDPNNCGACGNACAPTEHCFDRGSGMACQCRDGTTYCAGVFPYGGQSCADVSNDPNNCGSCNYKCPFVQNATPTCTASRCTFECNDGLADCNGSTADGCETLIKNDPRNCGGCGIECDVGHGQPCVDGKCAVAECDAGVTK